MGEEKEEGGSEEAGFVIIKWVLLLISPTYVGEGRWAEVKTGLIMASVNMGRRVKGFFSVVLFTSQQ